VPVSRLILNALRRAPVRVAMALGGVAVAGATVIALTGRSPVGDARYHRAGLDVGGVMYEYMVYVPASYRAASTVPLVVVLHGCRTTASQQVVASGYAPIADRRHFIVLYPDVDPVDRSHGDCWKGIWDPGAEGRGRGDAGAIAAMTSAVMRTWRIDPARVYVIGISAGAFESSILGASYPDLYAAIGIHSGAAYLGGEEGCLAAGESPTNTATLAHAAMAAMAQHARVMPVILFHGDQDQVIPYRCGEQALRQWLDTDNLVLERERSAAVPVRPATVMPGVVVGGHRYTVTSYLDDQRCTVAQLWTIHGMGHAWSGGSGDPTVAQFTDPRGPSAAAASVAFFFHWSLSRGASVCAHDHR
jgi:poly(hydroxyalkanoate) depolymerase family esterase